MAKLLTCQCHVFGEGAEAQVDGGAHEGEALVVDAVATRVWQLVDQAVGTQELQQSPDAAAPAATLLRIMRSSHAQMTGDVAGVEATLDVFATQDRKEQLLILICY